MKRRDYLSFLCDAFEKDGRLAEAWQIAAEIAQSRSHDLEHPIHQKLLALERMAAAAQQKSEITGSSNIDELRYRATLPPSSDGDAIRSEQGISPRNLVPAIV